MRSFAENATIVLVQGAWADGSCRQDVILPLRKEGLEVFRSDGRRRKSKESRVAVTTKLTPSDEAEGQCGAPECALQNLAIKENDDV